MRLCMPPSSALGIPALLAGDVEKQTEDSEPRSSQLRLSSSMSATDTRGRSTSDRYSYRAAVSQLADD